MPSSGTPGVYTAVNMLADTVFIKLQVALQSLSRGAVREVVLPGHFSVPPAIEQAGPHGKQHGSLLPAG